MPLYDYKCSSCEHVFTKSLKIADRNLPIEEPCPDCNLLGSITKVILTAARIGYSIAPGMRTSDNFNSRLKEMKSAAGKTNTIGDSIK